MRLRLSVFALLVCCAAASAVDFQSVRHEVSTSVFGRYAKLGTKARSDHLHYNSAAAGVAYTMNMGRWQAGAAIAFEHGKRKYADPWKHDPDLGDLRIRRISNIVTASIFGAYSFDYGWYLAGSASVAFEHINNKDWTSLGEHRTYRKKYTHVAASLEVGKHIAFANGFYLRPHLALQGSITERQIVNTDGPWMDSLSKSQPLLNIPLGVEFGKTWSCGAWQLTPHADLTMVVTEADSRMYESFHPGFAAYTNRGWTVYGQGNDRIGMSATAGVKAKLRERVSLNVDYNYTHRRRYRDHRMSATFALAF